MRIPAAWRAPLEQGRLLVLSAFDGKVKRPKAYMAEARNRLVAALADELFVAHASPGGKTESLCREIAAWGKPLWTVAGPENANLFDLGAKKIGNGDAAHFPGRAG